MKNEKSKHTPGPWGLWADNRRETIFTVITPPDKYGSRIVGIQVRDPLAVRQMELENTASLISAAPELLAALEMFKANFESAKGPRMTDCIAAMKAAISKAKGE